MHAGPLYAPGSMYYLPHNKGNEGTHTLLRTRFAPTLMTSAFIARIEDHQCGELSKTVQAYAAETQPASGNCMTTLTAPDVPSLANQAAQLSRQLAWTPGPGLG